MEAVAGRTGAGWSSGRCSPRLCAVQATARRPRATCAVPGGGSRRGGASGLRAGAHGPCAPLLMRPDRRFLPRPPSAAESLRFNPPATGIAANGSRGFMSRDGDANTCIPDPSPRQAQQKTLEKSTRGFAPGPQGKEVKTQGVSVRAIRNPRMVSRRPVEFQSRMAERRYHGMLNQEPPRSTRRSQFHSHALPFTGAPAYPSI